MDAIPVLFFFGLMLAIFVLKRSRARRRLAQVETGQRCLACDGTEMQRLGPIARCMLCGHAYNVPQMAWKTGEREAIELAGSSAPDHVDRD